MKLSYTTYIGIFLLRPNRFIAHVDIDGTEVICHVPNTGRLRELLIPGVTVLISHHPSVKRKTQYELRMVIKEGNWISIDSQLPNSLAHEAIAGDVIVELAGYPIIKREVTYENSRFDIQLIRDSFYDPTSLGMNEHNAFVSQIPDVTNASTPLDLRPCFVEVKGVTLEKDNWSYFPDAPTDRGKKHIDELIHAVQHGYRAAILFIVQVEKAEGFTPNYVTDKEFHHKIKAAKDAGVEILAYRCIVSPEEVTVVESIPVVLHDFEHDDNSLLTH